VRYAFARAEEKAARLGHAVSRELENAQQAPISSDALPLVERLVVAQNPADIHRDLGKEDAIGSPVLSSLIDYAVSP
jgi:hypothetical protein